MGPLSGPIQAATDNLVERFFRVNGSPRKPRDRPSSSKGEMPFLWLSLEDQAGPESRRGYIERNSIALLSNYQKPPLDPPSLSWLGRYCERERVSSSGLWNIKGNVRYCGLQTRKRTWHIDANKTLSRHRPD
jgi:hypothetical protein